MAFFKDLNDDNPTEKPEVLDVDSIRQSVLDLLLTNEGEVPFNPRYGLSLPNYLFELDANLSEFDIFSLIVNKLDEFENRVSLSIQDSSAVADPDTGKFTLNLSFIVEGTKDNLSVQATI